MSAAQASEGPPAPLDAEVTQGEASGRAGTVWALGLAALLSAGYVIAAPFYSNQNTYLLHIAALLSAGYVIAAPFYSNQNTYLLHGVGEQIPSLATDWLLGTIDPYPFFSHLVGAVYQTSGYSGLRFITWAGAFVAFLGVWLIARALTPPRSPRLALVALVLVGLSVNPIVGWVYQRLALALGQVPGVGALAVGRGPSDLNLFSGFGGQSTLSLPGYMQPSLAGVLLLPAAGLWMALLRSSGGRDVITRARFGGALALTALACMLHPTYLVATILGLLVAAVVDLTCAGWRWVRLTTYAAVAGVVTVLTLVANPSIVTVGSASAEYRLALDRLAFERIPHHTLWTDWPTGDLGRVLLVLLAIWAVRRLANGLWLQRWLAGTLAVAMLLAVWVERSESSALALLFPWRISVVLVPTSAVVLAVCITVWAARVTATWRAPLVRYEYVLLAAAGMAAVPGLTLSWTAVPLSESDAATRLVSSARPTGVGLVPLDNETLRLNAEVPIYVDWKSHPLVGRELAEWWRRIDQVREWEALPGSVCGATWAESIEWALVDAGDPLPTCLQGWRTLGAADGLIVLQKPA